MEKEPRRRYSRELPPYLQGLMDTLIKLGRLFIRDFGYERPKLTEIAEAISKIAEDTKTMHKRTDTARTAGVVTSAVGLGAAVVFAPFTGVLNLFGAGVAVAAGGAGTAISVNVSKTLIENGTAKDIEKKANYLLEVVKPLQEMLLEIQIICTKLGESAQIQVGQSVDSTWDLQNLLEKLSYLRAVTEEATAVTAVVLDFLIQLLTIITGIFRLLATPEKDKELQDCILKTAAQCQVVISNLDAAECAIRKLINQ